MNYKDESNGMNRCGMLWVIASFRHFHVAKVGRKGTCQEVLWAGCQAVSHFGRFCMNIYVVYPKTGHGSRCGYFASFALQSLWRVTWIILDLFGACFGSAF